MKDITIKYKRKGSKVHPIGVNKVQPLELVTFTSSDGNKVISPQIDSLVVKGMVKNIILKRILVDMINLLMFEVCVALGFSHNKLHRVYNLLIELKS